MVIDVRFHLLLLGELLLLYVLVRSCVIVTGSYPLFPTVNPLLHGLKLGLCELEYIALSTPTVIPSLAVLSC